MKKTIIAAAAAFLALGSAAKAQTNLQVFYDFGKDRQFVTTTFEMFHPDSWGNTFFFVDIAWYVIFYVISVIIKAIFSRQAIFKNII